MQIDKRSLLKWRHSIVIRFFLVSFVCIHLPLISLLIAFSSMPNPGGWQLALIVLSATLVGTIACLGAIWHLTAPLRTLASVITAYRHGGRFADELVEKRGDDEIAVVTRAVCGMVGEIASLAERVEGRPALDPLTGLLNGSAAYALQLERMPQGSDPTAPFTVAVFEVAEFEAVQTEHGREAADLALVAVGDIVRQVLGQQHVTARMSGRTFVILFPGDLPDAVVTLCERIRSAVEKLEVSPLKRGELRVTFGLSVRQMGDAMADLIHRADMALFRARDLNRTGLEVFPR
ncbi:GGDEF domain-containing protein [Peteryoungia ipomoeae]|uniref:diguanylate cyclase n=1 Tax=Peteryoungia ipomoeae TaxID=1210932 RepID=A0A4S8P4F4_9HYPH|nr:GGDEF domain-containing protein [Peteryoungia ipomoeae]THV24943.1 GGDEF domain-containing protein [Peteryoungia ipomoeae]